MRHRLKGMKLGRTTAHRNALIANLACSLINERRIITTAAKAKLIRSVAEKLVTLAKKGDLPARRKAASILRRKQAVAVLFSEIVQQCGKRSGGYLRIVKLGQRRGDNAHLALVEWVDIVALSKKKKHVPEGKEAAPKQPPG